jgi:hypothetical protein
MAVPNAKMSLPPVRTPSLEPVSIWGGDPIVYEARAVVAADKDVCLRRMVSESQGDVWLVRTGLRLPWIMPTECKHCNPLVAPASFIRTHQGLSTEAKEGCSVQDEGGGPRGTLT